jgi:hypothetical protein
VWLKPAGRTRIFPRRSHSLSHTRNRIMAAAVAVGRRQAEDHLRSLTVQAATCRNKAPIHNYHFNDQRLARCGADHRNGARAQATHCSLERRLPWVDSVVLVPSRRTVPDLAFPESLRDGVCRCASTRQPWQHLRQESEPTRFPVCSHRLVRYGPVKSKHCFRSATRGLATRRSSGRHQPVHRKIER